jgi:hypothetical protein
MWGPGVLCTAIIEIVRKVRGFLWMNCHAKRMECVQLAGAVVKRGRLKSGSKLHALQTLRAVRLRLCRAVALRLEEWEERFTNSLLAAVSQLEREP